MIWIKCPRSVALCVVTRRQFSMAWLRSRSAPVTLQVLGVGLLPMGRRHPARCSFEPQKIIGTPPRSKWCTALPGGGPCVHRSLACAPLGRSQPDMARWRGRLGHSRCRSVVVAMLGGNASGLNQIWWLVANPMAKLTAACPIRFTRRRGSRRTCCRRAACGNRRVPACARPPWWPRRSWLWRACVDSSA